MPVFCRTKKQYNLLRNRRFLTPAAFERIKTFFQKTRNFHLHFDPLLRFMNRRGICALSVEGSEKVGGYSRRQGSWWLTARRGEEIHL
jgi:hypothetical protein